MSKRTILLAEKLGVPVVVDFSGCPGDSHVRPERDRQVAPSRQRSHQHTLAALLRSRYLHHIRIWFTRGPVARPAQERFSTNPDRLQSGGSLPV